MKKKFIARFIFCRHFDDERIINYEWADRV